MIKLFRSKKAYNYPCRLSIISWQGHVESNHDPRFWRPHYKNLRDLKLNNFLAGVVVRSPNFG